MSCQQLRWFEVQQMATGLCLGDEGITRTILPTFGPGSCLETCGVADGFMEVFQFGHMARGDSSWLQGVQAARGTPQVDWGVLPMLHGLPSSFPVALIVPQMGQLLRNTQSFGTTFHTVLMRLLCPVLSCQHACSLAKSAYGRLWSKPTPDCRHEHPCF